jgi:hypothetical protein
VGLFGWLSGSKKNIKPTTAVPVSPTNNDGSYIINSNNMSGYWGYSFDIDAAVTDDFDMILKYRDTASFPTADEAIEQIVDEMVIVDSEKPIAINLDSLPKQYNGIKKKIEVEWEKILDLYHFNRDCHDIVKRWYIDGRIFYYLIIDPTNTKKGIQDIRYIDPRKIKKVVEIEKETKDGVDIIKGTKEYYLFNDRGLANADKGLRLSPDCVVDVPSGLIDATSGKVISYLYKAIKPVNQLKMMEDALVIYRITRAPERRVFYIDVGNMPAQKAEQYVSNIMNKFRNKVQYDAKTGEIKNGRNYLSMMEDFFLPRREGGRSTEIQTINGGDNLSAIDDILYFQNRLYQSLGVPRQRLSGEQNNFQIGKSDNINRDEIIFAKMVHRLRNCFSKFFLIPLKAQLLAKKIISEKDWKVLENRILFDYAKDNYFEEIKEQEVLSDRINLLSQVDGFKGTYFSAEWIVKNVLNMTDEEWKDIQKQMKAEGLDSQEDGDNPFGSGNSNRDNGDNSSDNDSQDNDDSVDSSGEDEKDDSEDNSEKERDSEDDNEKEESKDDDDTPKKPTAKLLDSRIEIKKARGRVGRYVRKLSEDD